MIDFHTWLTENQQRPPEVVDIEITSAGKFLSLATGKKIGPIINLQAQQGDQTHTLWFAQSKLGKFLLYIDPQNVKKIVSTFHQANAQANAQRPQAGPMWFHRGVRSDKYLFCTPELMQRYEQAEEILKKWVDAGAAADQKDANVQKAQEVQRRLSPFCKDAFFSSSVDEAGGHGGIVLSIQLPPEVYRKYIKEGAGGRGVGASLLIPALELTGLCNQYPRQENPAQVARQKFQFKVVHPDH